MTSSRDIVFASVRRALGATGQEAPRRQAVADRIAGHPRGIIPARADLPPAQKIDLFKDMVRAADGTLDHLARAADVPLAVASYLRERNLPPTILRGADPRLANLPWDTAPNLDVWIGPSDGRQLAGLSHAFAGVAESGTVVMLSGPDNPSTLNLLPDHHLVVIDAGDVAGDYETVWTRIRAAYGAGLMPRTVNWITGPSRSADIEQTLLLGAHGPRSLHVLLVGAAL
ncbi:MAG TPA: lactate utilization protein [Xanthobacteraceae bacterium]|jgi:L-lactate dehydrogenase complex protein LldG|uniref:LutC/YkgG family protein n=1 Tax=Roseixanthobacter finlandensis TaxID=3119922 RepID=UPI000BD9B9F7|nr:MAG: lactate utilization protein [Rhizobiales bacterium 12-66-7]HQS10949.1 lactate utilization protein [Xanthobacteraceae bacterium]